MSKYNFPLELDGNNAPKLIAEQVKENSIVLELGPANGRLTQYLTKAKGCTVDIVEIDAEAGADAAKFARQCCLGSRDGNLESSAWFERLCDERYDAVIIADVLEHLRDPKRVLQLAKKLLKDGGRIWISVPNLAHNSVLINLINDRFYYNDVGLLDSTHIHFFGYYSLVDMIHEAGLFVEKQRAVYSRVAENEICATYDELDPLLLPGIKKRLGGNIYQFVFCLSLREDAEKQKPKLELVEGICEASEWEAVCYVYEQGDSEFQEEKSVKIPLMPGVNELEFNLCGFQNIEKLRFDPLNYPCMLRVREAWLSDCATEIVPQNGVRLSDGWMVFDDVDPVTYVKIPDGSFNKLRICCEYYVADPFAFQHLRKMAVEKDAELSRQSGWIEQLRHEGSEKDAMLAKQSVWIKELQKEANEKDAELAKQSGWIEQLRHEGSEKDAVLAKQSGWIEELQKEANEKDMELVRRSENIELLRTKNEEKDSEIKRQTNIVDGLKAELEEKNALIERLRKIENSVFGKLYHFFYKNKGKRNL